MPAVDHHQAAGLQFFPGEVLGHDRVDGIIAQVQDIPAFRLGSRPFGVFDAAGMAGFLLGQPLVVLVDPLLILLFPLGLKGYKLGIHRVAGVDKADSGDSGRHDQNRQYMLQMRIRVLFLPAVVVGHKPAAQKQTACFYASSFHRVMFLQPLQASLSESAGLPIEI